MDSHGSSKDDMIWIVNENDVSKKPKKIRKKDLKQHTNDWRRATPAEVKAIEARQTATSQRR